MLDRLNRHDLTDQEWERLQMFLPAGPPRGGRWADHRSVIVGIFFRARAGCPWRDLPEGSGNWKTVYNRHRRWPLDGTWEKILDGLRAGCDEAGGAQWTVSADSSGARAGTPPVPAMCCPRDCSRGSLPDDKNPPGGRAGREALGRSRGGLSTGIHLAAGRRCRPVTRILSPGQHGGCPQFIPLMPAIRISRRGEGRPRTRPGAAMGGKAYSPAANRACLRRRGIKAVIPVREDQEAHLRNRGSTGGRPPASGPGHYKERNTAGRCFGKLRQFRAVATRYGKRELICQGTADLAPIRIWLRDPVP